MPTAKLITIAEAASRIGVAHGTLTIQARRGKLKAKKMGRDWYVSEAEVDRYGKENRRGTVGAHAIAAAFDVPASIVDTLPGHTVYPPSFGAPKPAPKPAKRRGTSRGGVGPASE